MKTRRVLAVSLTAIACLLLCLHTSAATQSFQEQNEALLEQLRRVHGLSDGQMESIRAIFRESGYVGQGNPAITRHPMSPQECKEKLEKIGVSYENEKFEKICKAKYMAPLYNPATQKAEDARACIDQFEFPDIPCAYPVVWVRAREAALICKVEGKRICDAHEWEGACAGALLAPGYRFDLAKDVCS